MANDDHARSDGDTTFWTAAQTAGGIRAGHVTAEEIITSHLARLGEVNAEINAVTRIDPSAIEQARAVDRAIATGDDPGPLAGVPVTIKDNVDVEGQSTPNGVAALDDVIAPDDAPLVSNLRAAGAVVLGRTNTPEFSWRWHTDNPLFGPTRNPRNGDLTPGGSSGGAAAALAAGIGALANGNDAGGSLRWPAACTGTAALRTTVGRVPSHNATAAGERPPAIDLMAAQGLMSRSVGDLRLGLATMARTHWRDPAHVPAAFLVDHERRAGWSLTDGQADPAVAQAVAAAVGALDLAGWTVGEVEAPGIGDAATVWATMMNTDFHHVGGTRPLRETMLQLGSPAVAHMLRAFDRAGPPVDLASYIDLFAKRSGLLRRWQRLLTEEIDVLVLPVALEPAWPVDDDISSDDRIDEIFAANRPLVAINALGLPAAAVPVPLELTGGAPTGVQIVARRFAEDVALDAAEAVEAELGRDR